MEGGPHGFEICFIFTVMFLAVSSFSRRIHFIYWARPSQRQDREIKVEKKRLLELKRLERGRRERGDYPKLFQTEGMAV